MLLLIEKVDNLLHKNAISRFFVNRDNFVMIYVFMSMLYSIPVLIDRTDIFNKFCFVWGVLLIAWDVVCKRKLFQTVYWAMPVLLLGSYAVSVLLNFDSGMFNLAKHFVYTSITLLLLYSRDRRVTKEYILSLLKKINYIIIIFSLLTAFISLFLYVFSVSFEITTAGGDVIRQGFVENRLFGVYYSPNVGALVSVISFAAVAMNYILEKNKNVAAYVLFALNLILNFTYFSLTLSRGGALALIALAGLFSVLCLIPVFAEKKGTVRGVISGILISVILFGISYAAMIGIRTGISYVPGYVNLILEDEPETSVEEISEPQDENTTYTLQEETSQSENEENTTEEPVTEEPVTEEPITEEPVTNVGFDRIEDMADPSNGRTSIWTGALKLLKQSFLFGFGDYIIGESRDNPNYDISSLTPQEITWAFRCNGNLHNGYVQILMHSGVVGFLIFFVFAGLVILKLLNVMFKSKRDNELYKIIAILFSLFGAFAVNAMVESHLLFRRQNMFSSVFWVLVGISVVLAELLKSSDLLKDKKSETFAFVIASPLQGLFAMHFVCNDVCGCKNKSDAFVYHMFNKSEQLSEKLKETGVFENVYDIKEYKVYPGLLNKAVTFCRLFCPGLALKFNSYEKTSFEKKNYTHICMSTALGFTGTLHLAYPNASIIFFEDGTGSYCSDLSAKTSRFFEIFDRIFFDGNMHIHPLCIYLLRPQLARVELDYEILKMPELSSGDTLALVRDVFSYQHNNIYKNNKVIYITQPKDDEPGFSEINFDLVCDVLYDLFDESIVARVHPRDNADRYSGMIVDLYSNLWEIECMEQICDTNILIGVFSTAQVMPKILSDKEPVVIFLYKILFENCDNEIWQERRKFMDDFAASYNDPSRIYIPETITELRNILILLSGKN